MKRGPKYFSNPRADMPHIGEMLVAYYKKKKIRQAPLARDMNRSEKTMIAYKKNNSIQTAILWELCHVLRYNFFADLADALPQTFARNSDTLPNKYEEAIAALNIENTKLQTENDLLMRMMKDKNS